MIYGFAHNYSIFYGFFAVFFAVFAGWLGPQFSVNSNLNLSARRVMIIEVHPNPSFGRNE